MEVAARMKTTARPKGVQRFGLVAAGLEKLDSIGFDGRPLARSAPADLLKFAELEKCAKHSHSPVPITD
jgi:hypothetical protein